MACRLSIAGNLSLVIPVCRVVIVPFCVTMGMRTTPAAVMPRGSSNALVVAGLSSRVALKYGYATVDLLLRCF